MRAWCTGKEHDVRWRTKWSTGALPWEHENVPEIQSLQRVMNVMVMVTVTVVFNCDSGIHYANLSQYVVKELVPVGSLVPAIDCLGEPMTSDKAEDCFNLKLEPFQQRSTLPSWQRGGGQTAVLRQ